MYKKVNVADRKVGPNMQKLAAFKASRDAIPDGGGLVDAIDFIKDQNRFKKSMLDSVLWAFAAVDVMKTAPDNPYGDDDEVIAGAIVAEIEKRLEAG